MSDLLDISERLRTQDNRCTAEPMFCVQERRRVYGIDPQWCSDTVWVDTTDGCCEMPPPEDGREREGLIETGFHDEWHTVMVAFTEEGCKDYLRQNGHNHSGETRIFVESFRRCDEMIRIRRALMSNAGIERPMKPQKED